MRVPLNPPIWNDCAAVMATWEEGGYLRFALAGRTDIVSVEAADGHLLLYPERSSGHRALAAALGAIDPQAV